MTAEHTNTQWDMGPVKSLAFYIGDTIHMWKDGEFIAFLLTRDDATRATSAIHAHDGLVAELRKVLAVLDSPQAEWWMDVPGRGGFDRDGIIAALAKAGHPALQTEATTPEQTERTER